MYLGYVNNRFLMKLSPFVSYFKVDQILVVEYRKAIIIPRSTEELPCQGILPIAVGRVREAGAEYIGSGVDVMDPR